MIVVWSQFALDDLKRIFGESIDSQGPRAGIRIVERSITRRVTQLETFPESGRAVPEWDVPAIRELLEEPYRIIYRLTDREVEIVTLRHMAARPLD